MNGFLSSIFPPIDLSLQNVHPETQPRRPRRDITPVVQRLRIRHQPLEATELDDVYPLMHDSFPLSWRVYLHVRLDVSIKYPRFLSSSPSSVDVECECTSTAFQDAVKTCLEANCTDDDYTNALALQAEECEACTFRCFLNLYPSFRRLRIQKPVN